MRTATDLAKDRLACIEQFRGIDLVILMQGDGGAWPLIERAHPDIVRRNGPVFEWKAGIDSFGPDCLDDLADRVGTLFQGNRIFHFVEAHRPRARKNFVTPADAP